MNCDCVRYILIAGCQRSGTTLLGQILGSQTGCLLIDEPDGVMELIEALVADAPERHDLFLRCIEKAETKYRAPTSDIHTVVLKAPNATYLVSEFEGSGHDIRVVFATRDARDVVCSMLRLPHVPMASNQTRRLQASAMLSARFAEDLKALEDPDGSQIRKCAKIWKIKTSLYKEFLKSTLPTLTVRYEDLVQESATKIGELIEFCQLKTPKGDDPVRHDETMRGMGPGLTTRMRPIDRASLYRWQRQLDESSEQVIWNECGVLMTELEYHREPRGIRLPEARAAALDAPIVALGRGGSGTRLLSLLLKEVGVFLGNKLNPTLDSVEWVDLIYEMAIKTHGYGIEVDWRKEVRARAHHVLSGRPGESIRNWGWKLPETALVLDQLLPAFDSPCIIHLIRHPIDTCLRRSHMTSRLDNPVGRNALTAAYRHLGIDRDPSRDQQHVRNAVSWRFQIELIDRTIKRSGTSHLEIKYETLCLHPARTIRRVVEFLNLDPIRGENVLLPIDSTRMRKWKAGDPRAMEIWDICADLAGTHGYGFP